MDKGHPKGIFHLLARPYVQGSSLTPTQIHRHQQRAYGYNAKNIRSTQSRQTKLTEPEVKKLEQPTHLLFASIETICRLYTDQNGLFPFTSGSGHKYIFILYAYDANAILAEPINILMGTDILRAYTKMHTYLTKRGFKPRTHWLDNEAAQIMRGFDT